MSATDLVVVPAYLHRVQRLYPKAVGIGRITGYRHQVINEAGRMVKRGEIIAVWRFAKRDARTGIVSIPYVRLKELEQVRRERWIKTGLLSVGVLLFLGAVAYAVWSVWPLLMGGVGGAAALILLFRFGLHWTRGCTGLHCTGCRG